MTRSLSTNIKHKDNLVDLLDRQIRLYLTRLSSTNLYGVPVAPRR